MKKVCILDETKPCTDCGECNRCDLDPNKICDNCMKCIQTSDAEYFEIRIDDVSKPDPEMAQMLRKLLKTDQKSKDKKGN